MVGVAGHAIADDFGDDIRAAALGEFERFENQHAGAFADDEAVALGVEGAAGALGFVIARGERAHGGESADAHGSDGRFGAAGDHHFRVAALDDFVGVANGVRRSRAGRGRGGVGALRAVANGNVAGGEIDDRRGNEEREKSCRGRRARYLECSRSMTSNPPMPEAI